MKFTLVVAAIVLVLGTDVDATGDNAFTYHRDSGALSLPQWPKRYPTCAGSKQSPINLTNTTNAHSPFPLKFTGSCLNLNMTATSESYTAIVNGGNCTIATKLSEYKFAQFHLHSPSEHTIDGKAFDGEIHFVHKKADSSGALVVGLFLQKTNDSHTESAVNAIVDAMSSVSRNSTIPMALGSYSKLLSTYINQGHVFNYAGSLTTPPCTEFVDWWVIRTPARISSAQFNRIVKTLAELEITDEGKNARPVQPLNGRTVTMYSL